MAPASDWCDLQKLLGDVGLGAFGEKFTMNLQALLEMNQEDLTDVAMDVGMKKDNRKTFLQLIQSLAKSPGWNRFVALMEENELSMYVDKIHLDHEKLLVMGEEELKEVATDAGMKKESRVKFLKLVETLRGMHAADERCQLLQQLMQENGLAEYTGSFNKVEKLLEMDEEDLRDLAIDLGMPKEVRKKFSEVLEMMRESNSSTSDFELVEAPPDELLSFLKQKGLEKYAFQMWNHENADYSQVNMLMSLDPEDLMAAAVDCGFAKEDRKKLGELVVEERQRILAKPSIGGTIFHALEQLQVEKRNGVQLAHLPFKHVVGKDYMYSFGESFEPKQHRCLLRVMEAQIPSTYLDEDIAKEMVVLVVGQTGAGKSTQIDGMLNYLLGIKWEEDIRFKVVNELETVSKESLQAGSAASQTDAVTAYKIPAIKGGPVKSKLTIVDTPGFGDTRGLHFDHKIVDQMKKFFNDMSDHVSILTGVCFVAQASAARLTESQQYVWNAILGLFGKDIADNILLCFTFADGEKPQALEAVQAGGIPMKGSFKFNNSALFVDPSGPATDAVSKMFWDMGQRNMSEFFQSLACLDSKSLHLSKQVMEEREQLEVSLENLGPEVKLTLGIADSLQQQAQQFALYDDQLEGSKDFKLKVKVPKFRKIPTTNNTTTCTECDKTCHTSCIFANDSDKQRCCVMSSGHCTVCPKKCHWTKHQNLPYILEWYTEEQEKTLDDLKAKYDEANKGKLDKEKIMQGLLQDLNQSNERVAFLVVRMKKCRQRLDEIAMRPNTLPNEEYLQMMIENEKNNQQPGWQGRVAGLERLKTQGKLMKDAEDPEFSKKLLAKRFTHDQPIQRAARTWKKKGSNAWTDWIPAIPWH